MAAILDGVAECVAVNQVAALARILSKRNAEAVQVRGAECDRVPEFCW